jgi:predicted aminopeptidase
MLRHRLRRVWSLVSSPRSLRIMTGLLLSGFVLALAAAWYWQDTSRYLLQSVQGQLSLLSGARPIAEMLTDPKVSAAQKAQFREVAEVKRFAETPLGLKPTRNYEKYLDLKRDFLVMVLTASPPLKMESKTWWFPVVGTVPYKGYYDLALARKELKALEAEGFETHFRPSPAYSTLGWFQDPLLNTMLQYGEFYLVSTVIHESVHATLWIPGDVSFNENLASFIGYHGALSYFARRYGRNSTKFREAEAQQGDQKIFAAFMGEVHDRLKALYDSDAFNTNKHERKKELINSLKTRYRQEITPQFKGKGYQGFEQRTWNNAMIMAYQHYDQEQEFLEDLLRQQRGDVAGLMKWLSQQGPQGIQNLRQNWQQRSKTAVPSS